MRFHRNSKKYQDYKMAFYYLSHVLVSLPLVSDNNIKLQALFQSTSSYIQKSTDIDLACITNNVSKQSNYTCLLIKGFAIYSTASGIFSSALPGFIAQGLLAMSCSALMCSIFLIPALVVVPYFVYKLQSGTSKTEHSLQIKEIVLKAQKQLIEQVYWDQLQQKVTVGLKDKGDIIEFRKNRQYFNSTALGSFCLFGTVFASGCTVLSTLSVCTLFGCFFVLVVSLALGLAYAHYHAGAMRQSHQKKHELAHLKKSIQEHEFTLFKESKSINLNREANHFTEQCTFNRASVV